VTASANNAVVVPRAALAPKPGRDGGFTTEVVTADGRLASRDVEIGIATRFVAQVVDGLDVGERVVTGRKGDGNGQSLLGFRL
jgi:macrolide-specific efflux system membrane fusion protein